MPIYTYHMMNPSKQRQMKTAAHLAQVSPPMPEQVTLAQGSTTIGRSRSNDMVLPSRMVSAHHAKIMTFGNSAYIQDLDSTNGIFVNGKPKQYQVLHQGDSVHIGDYYFIIAGFEPRPRARATETPRDNRLISSIPTLTSLVAD